ncbi:Putative SET domain-containing protein L678 [Harpegnathos saltator]|uniref:Putative SET domain-containing protein L678 n=1 Tax=Harpegnathos saltator TaxID=610380 RepID=E2BRE2_HARSA|nr:Putative SET domain-containing protein L678 [Harpegnathos saltator]
MLKDADRSDAQHTNIFGTKLPGNFKALAKNDNAIFLGGLMLRHHQIISINNHLTYEEQYLSEEVCGNAILPFCSLFNHSCNPNVFRVSRSQHTVLYTLYPIRKGEQLLDNYGCHFTMQPKLDRQNMLLQQYYFTCKCVPCQENWPLLPDLKSFETLAISANDKKMIRSVLKKFYTYLNMVEEGDVLDKPYIIEDLLTMIRVMYDRVPIACQEMSNVVKTLKQVYALLYGNSFILPTQNQNK